MKRRLIEIVAIVAAIVIFVLVVYLCVSYIQKSKQGLILATNSLASLAEDEKVEKEPISYNSTYIPVNYEYTQWEIDNEISLAKEAFDRFLPSSPDYDGISLVSKIDLQSFIVNGENIKIYVKESLVSLTEKDYLQLNSLVKMMNPNFTVVVNEPISSIIDTIFKADYETDYERIRKSLRLIKSCIKEEKNAN